jgi:hypothetical protein
MRLSLPLSLTRLALLPLAFASASGWTLQEQAPAVSPIELVGRTVQNEIKASNDTASYMFRVRKETPHGSQTRLMVQTRDAMAAVLVAIDDQPLNPKQREAENARVQHLMNDPEGLRRKHKQEKEDSERVTRMVRALPDALLYEFDGTEVGRVGLGKPGDQLVRLKFRPNPHYVPPSRVEQVLTAMQGYLLIDASKDRIAKIDGTLMKDVGFGWGILGHLDRGGHFLVEQGDVSNDSWEITQMKLSFTGKMLFFKGITIKSNEVYSDFHPVPSDLTFAQGVELLRRQEAVLADNRQQHVEDK